MIKEPYEIVYHKYINELIIQITYKDYSKEILPYKKINGSWELIIRDVRLDIELLEYNKIATLALLTGENLEPREDFIKKWKADYIKRAREIYQRYRVKILANGLDRSIRKLL